jgi:dTDP-L-rhamnose 4-epimerase
MLGIAGSDRSPLVPGVFRVGDTRHTVSDISALRKLGWEPAIPVEQSIREYLEWLRPQEDTRRYLAEADAAMREQHVLREVCLA